MESRRSEPLNSLPVSGISIGQAGEIRIMMKLPRGKLGSVRLKIPVCIDPSFPLLYIIPVARIVRGIDSGGYFCFFLRTALRARPLTWSVYAIGVLYISVVGKAVGGPPFKTDDPEPVGLRHWEVYIASQTVHDADVLTGTAPHLEVNNGALPNLQVHLIIPLAYAQLAGGPLHCGLGDVELGVKYRFVEETDAVPQIGTFPLLEVPTGNSGRALGNGAVQAFLPVWLQKSWGRWTTYGGAGYWHNPGEGNQDHWFGGWEAQYDLSEHLTAGAEILHASPETAGAASQTGFDLGAIYNIDDGHHILFSAGRDFKGTNQFSMYVALLWTFGPSEPAS